MKAEKFRLVLSRGQIFGEDCEETRGFYEQSRFGELVKDKFQYSLVEGLYLMEKNKVTIVDGRGKKLSKDNFIKKARNVEPNFWVRYFVFSDMRSRGYIVKTALKFGADFRVYDRGIKPGEDHAKWILYPVSEGGVMTWYEFSAKNRVAHSTRKRLLLGVVDDEGDVTYYEVAWKRP